MCFSGYRIQPVLMFRTVHVILWKLQIGNREGLILSYNPRKLCSIFKKNPFSFFIGMERNRRRFVTISDLF